MPRPKLRDDEAADLLAQARATDAPLYELDRDLFERVYRRRYKRAYAYYDANKTIGPAMVAHCLAVISKQKLH